ncbi:site-specific integrase [Methyloparacoccus murrellii]
MGLGSFPAVSLADARQRALEAHQQVAAGVDPFAARNRKEVRTPTFTSCAAAYIRAHRHGWKNRKHARQWVATLKTYARPFMGALPVDQVGTEAVLQVLRPIWLTRPETAKRVQGRLENVLDFAAARGWRDPLNPARWRGHLAMMLPKRSKVQAVEHHPAMPFEQVPAFMRELAESEGLGSKALQFLILTAARSGEVLGAVWSEIDLEARIWTIPGTRMKAGREHQVPLSDAAMAILEGLPRVSGEGWVFPGQRAGRPLSGQCLLQTMRRMGYGVGGSRGDFVPHGFRSSFRDWAGEVSTYPNHVCEMALAHVIENKAESAYRRGSLLEKRRAMMGEWSDYVIPPGGNVVAFRRVG